ncbi:DAK2 domain-containing protein [Dethiobacter alkaliphilus]|uniref:Dak phosphatase n=1 Tax=Dethiobacter alkaliphilus AHT 1 TaxID=555088 RepID=C0GHJ3_DETAL|nr:DAK2 domain-containing protein [Dethiobacter alkaliphilus]EEG77199.1 Dak phosphatase [Dethiobacter alkaliphilus AHT 1]
MQQLVGSDLKQMLIAGARLLENNKEIINAMNTFPVPDGDTGTNMSLTMRSALNEVQKASDDSFSAVAKALSTGSLLGARGNSGVILSQLFRGFAKGLEGKEKIVPKDFAAALQAGVDTAYKAVMKPVEGTMLTIARESAKAAATSAGRRKGFTQVLMDVVQHAEAVLEKTPEMLPVLKEAGVVDAGGKGLIHIYEGFLLYLLGEEIPEAVVQQEEQQVPVKPMEAFKTEDILFSYCTEVMVRGERLDADKIREQIKNLGDSLLAVGDEAVVKVHIHTNNPGQVLEACLSYGTLHNIKIDNMKEQHQELLIEEAPAEPVVVDGKAVVAVAAGDGIAKIFESLGVAKVVLGGQTMNPSTEDLLQAVVDVPQKEIILLPNNKNIVLAAKQVGELVDKDVRVVETRTVPQGITSMLSFNEEEQLDQIVKMMDKARQDVKSGQVTFAVCDSRVGGQEINENDIIGISEDDIVLVGSDVVQAVKDLLFKMVDEDDEIITLYYGESVDEEDAGRLQKELSLLFNGKDVELYEGGQPFYYYIVSVE